MLGLSLVSSVTGSFVEVSHVGVKRRLCLPCRFFRFLPCRNQLFLAGLLSFLSLLVCGVRVGSQLLLALAQAFQFDMERRVRRLAGVVLLHFFCVAPSFVVDMGIQLCVDLVEVLDLIVCPLSLLREVLNDSVRLGDLFLLKLKGRL